MDGWNTSFVLGWPIFRCYVSFREGSFRIFFINKKTSTSSSQLIFPGATWLDAMQKLGGFDADPVAFWRKDGVMGMSWEKS